MSIVLLLLAKLLKTALLLMGLAVLGYGGYRLVDNLWLQFHSVPGKGEVVGHSVRLEMQSRFGGESVNSIFDSEEQVSVRSPTIRYRSPVDGKLHRATTEMGLFENDSHPVGALVPIRISTTNPAEARLAEPLRVFGMSTVWLIVGLFVTLMVAGLWYGPEAALGRDASASWSLFRSSTMS